MSFIQNISWWIWLLLGLFVLGLRDVLQRKHTIQHNFPILGHLRYLIERIGPEIRQYIVSNNREELPFNRRQRAWIYASSKKENNFQGFGSDQDMNSPGFVLIKPALLAKKLPEGHPSLQNPWQIPALKIIGKGRQKPYRPRSVIHISGMSFGSLSAAAVASLNKGAAKFGCYQNTGEGGLSPYHKNGADVVLNIGTSYFGIRDQKGHFVMQKLVDLVNQNPEIKMLELKLSQGAKPGKGGVLPASKITKEIAEIRGLPMHQDVISPASHSAFDDVPTMIDFIESMAKETGLPVGIKSAIGKLDMWEELAKIMVETGKGPDFITIDGGEGGTGAAPPSFADHVSLPWVFGFSKIYALFQKYGLENRVSFIASGKLGLPDTAVMAFAMGADLINVAREAMLSIGCIQAQLCHTNNCPTGIATQNKWLQSGVDPSLKSERAYQYLKTLQKEIHEISLACGYEHPGQFGMEDVDISSGDNNATRSLAMVYGYQKTKVPFNSFSELI